MCPAARWRQTSQPVEQSCFSRAQVVRLQNSAAFRSARELDFENDAVGSLGQLMCGTQPPSGSDNASAGARSTPWAAISAGNSSGGSCIRSRFSIFILLELHVTN